MSLRTQRCFDDHYEVIVGIESASPPSMAVGGEAGIVGIEIELLSDLVKLMLSDLGGEDSIVWSRFITQPSPYRDASREATRKLIEDKRRISGNISKYDRYLYYRKNRTSQDSLRARRKKRKKDP